MDEEDENVQVFVYIYTYTYYIVEVESQHLYYDHVVTTLESTPKPSIAAPNLLPI